MIGTKVDQEVFDSLPKDRWFSRDDFPFLKNADHRFQRLVAQGRVRWEVKNDERVYRVCESVDPEVRQSPKPEVKRPMLDKWASMIDERRKLTELYEFLLERNGDVSLYDINIEKELDEFHGIDQAKLECERRALLDSQREQNEKGE